MSRPRFLDRFFTSDPENRADSAEGHEDHSSPVHESFYGRFSTSKGRKASDLLPGSYVELLLMLAVAALLVFGFVRPFIVAPMLVPSESMTPTLEVGDRVLTNKLVYDLTNPEKGDLVVFQSVVPERGEDQVVKRVVGLPGDEIEVRNGTLIVNGKPPPEPYVLPTDASTTPEDAPGVDAFGPVKVPEDHAFVMGDNRANSYDSRFFGPVPYQKLVGKVSLRFWPPTQFGTP